MCGTNRTIEKPDLFLDYVSNPELSWNGDTFRVIFYHWSIAGCPNQVTLPAPVGGLLAKLIALAFGLIVTLTPICVCLLPICICCCVILTPILIICGCLSCVIMTVGAVLFFSSRRVKYVKMDDETAGQNGTAPEASVNNDQTPLEPAKTQMYSGF